MKMRVPATPVRLAITWAFVLGACLLGQDRGGTPPAVGQRQIGGVFSKADASGSLEYWGVCNFKEPYPDFPKLNRISSNEDSVVDSLREMFSLDPKMRVSQDADGRIRMIEEDVPSDLLDVKIDHVRVPVEYHELNAANAALGAILTTHEVIAFRREHNIGPPANVGDISGYSIESYSHSKPKFQRDLHDVTVRQALDYVLLAFHGFWLYENCKDPGGGRIVFFAFFENEPGAQLIQRQK